MEDVSSYFKDLKGHKTNIPQHLGSEKDDHFPIAGWPVSPVFICACRETSSGLPGPEWPFNGLCSWLGQ